MPEYRLFSFFVWPHFNIGKEKLSFFFWIGLDSVVCFFARVTLIKLMKREQQRKFALACLSIFFSGLPKAKVFCRSRNFSIFGPLLWLPKFYSKYSAFGFVIKMGHYSLFLSLKAIKIFNS
jgi:hypothetical protein